MNEVSNTVLTLEQLQSQKRQLHERLGFRYSDEEWNKAWLEVPSVDCSQAALRFNLEINGGSYITWIEARRSRPNPTLKRQIKATEHIGSAASKLAQSLTELGDVVGSRNEILPFELLWWKDLGCQDKQEFVNFRSMLTELQVRAQKSLEKLVVQSDNRPKISSNASDINLEMYLCFALREWKSCGGKLRISRHPVSGEATGPLVRFLNATTVPVFRRIEKKALSGDALVAFVRKARGDRTIMKLNGE